MDGLLWNWSDKNSSSCYRTESWSKGYLLANPDFSFWSYIIPTNLKDPIQSHLTEQIYNSFLINKVDVLLDDRNDRAGVKFKDAELIGIPFQIIIGRDSVNKEVELLCRTNNTKFKISTDKLLEKFISESEIMYNKKS